MDTMSRCCAGLDVHKETVAASVRKTHHAVVVEEPPPACGIAAEVATNMETWVRAALRVL